MSTKLSHTAYSSESAAPWTATRCHRLLRPLLTHIAALRKDKERRALIRGGQDATTTQQSQLTNTKPRKSVVLGKRPRGYPESDDDYSEKKKKKPCRQYGRRGRPRKSSENPPSTPYRNGQQQTQRRQQASRPSQDVEVVLHTPFLRRVRSHQPSSPVVPPEESAKQNSLESTQIGSSRCHHSACCKTRCSFDMELSGLRRTIEEERHGLFESVFKATDALLKASSPRKNHAAGAKSLLAMCLRKVPDYIEWEKKETEEEDDSKAAPKDCGLSFEIYSELETLGPSGGWKNLCIVARAHAVKIIQDAAAEGLLEDSITDLLIRLCLEYMPHPEFTVLIETYVMRQYPRPRGSPDDDMFTSPLLRPLRILKACDPSGTSLLPRMLADLFVEGFLPSDWILTKGFSAFWPSMVGHVAAMKPCQDTIRFIIETLKLLCSHAAPRKPRGVPQTQIRGKAQNTLVSAVGALGSVVMLSEEGISDQTTTSSSSSSSSTNRTMTIKRRVEFIVETTFTDLKKQKNKGRKLGTYLLALCSFLSIDQTYSGSQSSSPTAAAVVESAWKGVSTCKGNPGLMLQYDATTALMSSVAHFCGRGTGLPPNVYLERLCDKLECLALPAQAVKGLRVDGAFKLAEVTGDLRDLKYAEESRAKNCVTPVKDAVGNRGGDNTKKKTAAFGGLRWDDVISEWVLGTPGSVVPKREVESSRKRTSLRGRAVGVEEDDDDSEEEGSEYEEEGHELDIEDQDEADSVEADSDSGMALESSSGEEEEAFSPNTEVSLEEMVSEDEDSISVDEIVGLEDITNRNHHDNNNNSVIQSSAKKKYAGQLLLAARPKRLSKHITITKGGDELAFDALTTTTTTIVGQQHEKWLSRKKPLRFATSNTAASASASMKPRPPPAPTKKRVQRASLMSLRSVENESDDELSFI